MTTEADRRFWSGLLLGLAGAVLFSAKAVIIKLAYRHATDPTTLIGLRMAFAAPLFAIVAWAVDAPRADGRSKLPGPRAQWLPGDRWRIAGIGLIGYYAASYLDFLGLQYVSAGLERLILYLSPTIVLLLGRVLYGRRIVPMQWAALVVCYVGTLVVYAVDMQVQGPSVGLGSALVFASAVAYAIYLVSSGEVVRRIGSLRLTAWASLVACTACVVQSLVLGGSAMFRQEPAIYGLSVVNAVLCTFIPLFLTMMSVERLGSGIGAQVGMIGPASTIVLAAMFLDEPVTAVQLIGTAIVLGGALLLTRARPASGAR